jgi:hypothetical protein
MEETADLGKQFGLPFFSLARGGPRHRMQVTCAEYAVERFLDGQAMPREHCEEISR